MHSSLQSNGPPKTNVATYLWFRNVLKNSSVYLSHNSDQESAFENLQENLLYRLKLQLVGLRQYGDKSMTCRIRCVPAYSPMTWSPAVAARAASTILANNH